MSTGTLTEKKQRKPKYVKVECPPSPEQLSSFAAGLEKVGFVVAGTFLEPEGGQRAAEDVLTIARRERPARAAVWFVPCENFVGVYVESLPSFDEIVAEKLRVRMRHPGDYFEDVRAMSHIKAPLFGLAGAVASEIGISSDWSRDGNAPMRVFVTKNVPAKE